jgi:hypothetical protein
MTIGKMMPLEQLRPYWDKLLTAQSQIEAEHAFESLLKLQHPELQTTTKDNVFQNCQILLHYLLQFERALKRRPLLQIRELVEILTNFLRIWILDLMVQASGIF